MAIRTNSSSSNHDSCETGSVLLIVVVLVALLAAVVMGHLQVNMEETQLVRNQSGGTEALALAEAGLNDALARLQHDPGWKAGFVKQPFASGTCTVTLTDATVTSVAVTSRGYTAKMEAEIAKGAGKPPCAVEIRRLRINR